PFPVCEVELIERSDNLNASIADKHVNFSELLDRPRDTRLHLLLIRHIHDHAQGFAGITQFRRGRIAGLLVQIGDRDARSLAYEGFGDLLADAAGGAGHDGNFVLEPHVTILPPWPAWALTLASSTAANSHRRLCRGRA